MIRRAVHADIAPLPGYFQRAIVPGSNPNASPATRMKPGYRRLSHGHKAFRVNAHKARIGACISGFILVRTGKGLSALAGRIRVCASFRFLAGIYQTYQMSIRRTGRYSAKYGTNQPFSAPLYNVLQRLLPRYALLNTGLCSNIKGLRHGRGWVGRWAGSMLRQAVGTELYHIQGYPTPPPP